MRDYLSPAKTYLGKAREQVAALSRVSLKPRMIAMVASTAAVAFFAASVIALRTMSNESSALQGNVIKTETKVAPGSTSSIQVGDPQPSVSDNGASSSSVTQTTSGNTNDLSTSVIVNNQSVPVPENGTVNKTITNNGSTTKVEISTSTNGSSNNSSFSSSNVQMSTNTVSQNMNIKSP